MYAFAKLPAVFCPLQATSRICLNVGHEIVFFCSAFMLQPGSAVLLSSGNPPEKWNAQSSNEVIKQDHTTTILATDKKSNGYFWRSHLAWNSEFSVPIILITDRDKLIQKVKILETDWSARKIMQHCTFILLKFKST